MMKLFDRLQKLVEAALAIMLAVMMCVVFAQTFTRYIVFHSIPWSEELSRFLFVGIIVLGINLGISRNQMVRIDILDNYLGGKAVRYAEIIRNLIGLVMNGAFAWPTLQSSSCRSLRWRSSAACCSPSFRCCPPGSRAFWRKLSGPGTHLCCKTKAMACRFRQAMAFSLLRAAIGTSPAPPHSRQFPAGASFSR